MTFTSETENPDDLVWCFQCGNSYEADVEECVECGVPTTDEPPSEAADVGGADEEQLAYEFHEWTGQGRSVLDGMLARLNIDHAWQGATLIIREADEEAVDQCVAEAEVVAMPTLDTTQPTVIYELDELDELQHGRLLRRMNEAGISHAFDREGALFVYERDEEKVDALFEGLDEADLSERTFGPGVPGLNPVEAMSDLFVAGERLRKKPNDAKGVKGFVKIADTVEQMSLPYGIGADVWAQVVDQTMLLSGSLRGEDRLSDDEIEEMATDLHDLLRPMV